MMLSRGRRPPAQQAGFESMQPAAETIFARMGKRIRGASEFWENAKRFWREEDGYLSVLSPEIRRISKTKPNEVDVVDDVLLPSKEEVSNKLTWQTVLFSFLYGSKGFSARFADRVKALGLRNSHCDLAEDALELVPAMKEALAGVNKEIEKEKGGRPHLQALLDSTAQPDLSGWIRDAKAIAHPEDKKEYGSPDQNYNPRAKEEEKGLGKQAVCTFYSDLILALELNLPELAARNAGKLSHCLADITIPYHAAGRMVGKKWFSPNTVEHAALELAFGFKRFRPSKGIKPKYIEGGDGKIAQRYEDEADQSYRLAKKARGRVRSFLWTLLGADRHMYEGKEGEGLLHKIMRKFVDIMNPFSESEMQEMYDRAVQLIADVWYAALIDAGRLLPPSEDEPAPNSPRAAYSKNGRPPAQHVIDTSV